MKPSMLDTDVLSEFLRGNPKVIVKVGEHLKEYGFVSLSTLHTMKFSTDFYIKMPENN